MTDDEALGLDKDIEFILTEGDLQEKEGEGTQRRREAVQLQAKERDGLQGLECCEAGHRRSKKTNSGVIESGHKVTGPAIVVGSKAVVAA